jgi:hypothetical protein
MRTEILKGHLETMLLAVLEQAPSHGYAVIEALRNRSSGQFDLPEGTVYPGLSGADWSKASGTAPQAVSAGFTVLPRTARRR